MNPTERRRKFKAALRAPGATRVFGPSAVRELADPGVKSGAQTRLLSGMEAEGDLVCVRRGLYLNRLCYPPATLDEAAASVRSGAVVSMQRALGQCGAFNNPWRAVTAVVPVREGAPAPSGLGQRDFPGGTFVFHAIAAEVLEAGAEEDRLAPLPYPRATPEAALVHWLWLGATRSSPVSSPSPGDIDVDGLDVGRLDRLASAVGMANEVRSFLEFARDEAADEEHGMPFSP